MTWFSSFSASASLFLFGSTILYTLAYMSMALTHMHMLLHTFDTVATFSGMKSLLSMYCFNLWTVLSGMWSLS